MLHKAAGFFDFLRKHAAGGVAFLCAAFMLCVVPLYFQDAFFDINRCKVNLVQRVMPPLCALMAAALILRGCRPHDRASFAEVRMPMLAMLALLAACVTACAVNGFEPSMLDGSQGRYCGLFFMLCCGGAFYAIACSAMPGRLIAGLMLACASAVALLGLLNAMGMDPLGFYVGIKQGQQSTFLSTIGHFDFFGTYLLMMFGVAAGLFVFGRRRAARIPAGVCAGMIAMGMCASRTDSAIGGMHLVLLAIAALTGNSLMQMARAAGLWAVCFIALPVVRTLVASSPYHPHFSGLPAILSQMPVAGAFALVFAGLSLFFYGLEKRGARAPGRRRLARLAAVVFAAIVVLLLAALLWFSVVDAQTDLGEAESFLRFNDLWGSVRGFAWIRSMRAFGDYTLLEKLFGRGMETTLSTLEPYFDDPSMIARAGGVFNDPHCQPLQMLLTCGLFGMGAFLAFYAFMVRTLLRRAGEDPLLCGLFGSLAGYLIIMLINVTQPILLSTYFSICGLALARVRARNRKEAAEP